MAQLAMQQTMDEITDYLATIDEKLDDVLRAQKDAVIADMIGVELVIDEAMTIREHVGRVSEVTWSKVQATRDDRATQAYALRHSTRSPRSWSARRRSATCEASQEAESKVQEWLAVLARCFQLQDAIGVLELDRVWTPRRMSWTGTVLDCRGPAEPAGVIARSTGRLMARMDEARARKHEVLRHPTARRSCGRATSLDAILDLHVRLGIEGQEGIRWMPDDGLLRRWRCGTRPSSRESMASTPPGLSAAIHSARPSQPGAKLSSGLSQRALRRRGDKAEGTEEG